MSHYREAKRELGLAVWEASDDDSEVGTLWRAELNGVTLEVGEGAVGVYSATAYFGTHAQDLRHTRRQSVREAKAAAIEWAITDLAECRKAEESTLRQMAEWDDEDRAVVNALIGR